MEDFRVKTGWRVHRKRKLLRKALGADGVLAIEDLWSYAAHSRPGGDLDGMTAADIAVEVDYPGDPDALMRTLTELRLVDGEPGSWRLHDWTDNQPYVANHGKRSASARQAANVRWASRGHADQCDPHAESMHDACDNHAAPKKGNAPYPYPSPSTSTSNTRGSRSSTPAAESISGVTGRLLSDTDQRRLRKLMPLSQDELDYAIAETRKAPRPSNAYCLTILEDSRARKPPPEPEPPYLKRYVTFAERDAAAAAATDGAKAG